LQEIGAVSARVLAAYGLAVSGGVISSLLAMSHDRLCRLISFAAGTLLGVTLFSLLPEIFFTLSLWQLLVGVASGYLLFFLISRFVFHVCPACAASHFDEATTHRFGEIAGAMVIALGLHSAIDGLALSVGGEAHMDGSLGLSLLLAICVHKIPEGLALCSLLLASGFKKLPALAWVAAVESTTLIGGAIGIWAAPRISGMWLDLILAHVGGGFFFLAIHAVFGELAKHNPKRVLISFFGGVALIAALNIFLRLI
jgi:ZIP family zinc transporter/zinc and cadmium transporter